MTQIFDIDLIVNGVRRRGSAEPRKTLADFLREDLELTGTHLGCEHGVCGACTVLVNGEAARSCLMFAVQAQGAEVTTIEGLATDGEMNPLQEALWANHSFQCGFCTPGFVMQITALLDENPHPTETEIRETLSGNICRCTGYESIVNGVLEAARSAVRWGEEDDMVIAERYTGASVRRKEDPRILTGRGNYIADVTMPGMVHAAFLRSPFPHARILSVDASEAREAPGVVAVFTGADMEPLVSSGPLGVVAMMGAGGAGVHHAGHRQGQAGG